MKGEKWEGVRGRTDQSEGEQQQQLPLGWADGLFGQVWSLHPALAPRLLVDHACAHRSSAFVFLFFFFLGDPCTGWQSNLVCWIGCLCVIRSLTCFVQCAKSHKAAPHKPPFLALPLSDPVPVTRWTTKRERKPSAWKLRANKVQAIVLSCQPAFPPECYRRIFPWVAVHSPSLNSRDLQKVHVHEKNKRYPHSHHHHSPPIVIVKSNFAFADLDRLHTNRVH